MTQISSINTNFLYCVSEILHSEYRFYSKFKYRLTHKCNVKKIHEKWYFIKNSNDSALLY